MNLAPLIQVLDELDQWPPAPVPCSERATCFEGIARFLEANVRPGQPFDLKLVTPNPLWFLFEDRLSQALEHWLTLPRPTVGALRVHQWYSSGVLVDDGNLRLGFDLVPLRRIFGWQDRYNLTGRLADALDALFVTHRHEDHYDQELVRACVERNIPVYMPETLAHTWKAHACIVPVVHDQEWDLPGVHVHARTGVHVWRDDAESLPLCVYECAWPDHTAIVYGGDADYTQMPKPSAGLRIKAYFLPWRAPNARYEDGDDRQIGPLLEAVELGLQTICPEMMFYVHCAELEHMHDGFPASFNMALDLKQQVPIASELMFWGEYIDLSA